MRFKTLTLSLAVLQLSCFVLPAQQNKPDSIWNLGRCIDYALNANLDVRQSQLTTNSNEVSLAQNKASRFPSVTGTVSQNFNWGRTLNNDNTYSSYSNSKSLSAGVSSSVVLFNGFKIKNTIRQSEVELQASIYNTETTKESISLSILDAYLQLLYAREQLINCQKQLESTNEQLNLAQQKYEIGSISKSSYLEVKSQQASEKLNLANAEKQLLVYRVQLMQLLEIPLSEPFDIAEVSFSDSILLRLSPASDSIYNNALAIKPQIKSADLDVQSAQLGVDVAYADYYPELTLSAGLSTGYTNPYSGLAFEDQFQNRITPSIGLTLSIPIYQKKAVRSQVSLAKINVQSAEIKKLSTRNTLRKEIEQACVNVRTAESEYQASLEQYNATQESFLVASEKLNQGLINSVEYIVQKTTFINAESELLQSKYNLIFSYKTLDFYTGTPLAL